MTTKRTDEMREAFEKWVRDNTEWSLITINSLDPEYDWPATRAAWEGWQAALASKPQVTEGEIAIVISGAPFASTKSLSKARALLQQFDVRRK